MYTHKVIIALDENATAFEFRALGSESPFNAEWLPHGPLRKFPVRVDAQPYRALCPLGARNRD